MPRFSEPTDRPLKIEKIFRMQAVGISMNIQIRLRVDEDFSRIGYIQNWLNETPRGFAFEHNKPGNHHYHIYLFGLERNPDAMRKRLAKHIPDKERYAIGETCGGKKKLKITPEGAYQYGSTKNFNSPIWFKGFSLTELEEYHKSAEEFYKPVEATLIVKEEHYVVRPDRVWERLHAKADDYSDMTIARIKSKLSVEYLNSGRAIPRPSDLHRYAMSLFYLNKYKKEQVGDVEIPDTALEEYYNNVRQ